MTYRRRVNAQISRFGEAAVVHHRTSSGTNSFGNTEWSFSTDPDGDGEVDTVLCARTYDNRNTEIQSNEGDRHRDTPLLLFPVEQFPGGDVRIEYPEPDDTTTVYELQAPTRYETHVEAFGEVVTNP